jgi:hypothetical protein
LTPFYLPLFIYYAADFHFHAYRFFHIIFNTFSISLFFRLFSFIDILITPPLRHDAAFIIDDAAAISFYCHWCRHW